MAVLIIEIHGGMMDILLSNLKIIPDCRDATEVLAERMQKASLVHFGYSAHMILGPNNHSPHGRREWLFGYCVEKKADCAVKVVPKLTPNEPVGVVCEVNGVYQVVEYSELNENTANRRTLSGALVFKAGNICNHIFRIDFLKNLSEFHGDDLTLHVAPKIIPYMDESGEIVRPTIPNGIKIEKFIFDVLPLSQHFYVWEVPRYTDFSPLKNVSGKDCPASCRRDLMKLHKKYVRKAGGTINCVELEISPLLSYAGENLEKYVDGKTYSSTTLLVSDHEHATDGT